MFRLPLKTVVAALSVVCGLAASGLMPVNWEGRHGRASAQEYESLAWEPLADESKRRQEVVKILQGRSDTPASTPTGKTALDIWFKGNMLSSMTRPERIAELTNDRNSFNAYLNRATDKEAHDYVVNESLKFLENIATRKFHPAARYNAMLMIGELNASEAVISTTSSSVPAEPLEAALPVMGRALSDSTQIDAVRVAALLGILRHVERESERETAMRVIARDPPLQTAIIKLMIAIVDGSAPPGERSPEGQLWMNRRAVNILGALGDVGLDNIVVVKLESILTDESADMLYRCDAAVALGRIRFPDGASPDPTRYADMLAVVASRAARSELRALAEHKRTVAEAEAAQAARAKAGYGSGGTPYYPSDSCPSDSTFDGSIDDGSIDDGSIDDGSIDSGGGYAPRPLTMVDLSVREKYKMDLSRRRLAYFLDCVKRGLEGPYDPSAKPPHPGVVPAGLKELPGIIHLPAVKSDGKQKEHVDSVLEKVKELYDAATQKPAEVKGAPPRTPKEELQILIDGLNTAANALEAAAGIKAPAPAVVPPVGPLDSGTPAGGPPSDVPSPVPSPLDAGPPAVGPPGVEPAGTPATPAPGPPAEPPSPGPPSPATPAATP
jgi:hypothetical protein